MELACLLLLLAVALHFSMAFPPIEYKKSAYGFKVAFFVGSERSICSFVIDTTSSTSWIAVRDRNDYFSSTSEVINGNASLYLHHASYNSLVIKDSFRLFQLESQAIEGGLFVFHLIEDNINEHLKEENSIGFAFEPTTTAPEASFISALNASGVINSLSFSLIQKDKYKGLLYLGQPPWHLLSNQSHSYCDAIGLSNHWDCLVSYVKLTRKAIQSTHYLSSKGTYVYFDSTTPLVYAPDSFLDFLYNFHFKRGIERGQCQIYKHRDERKYICDYYFIDEMGNITFAIGEYEHSFSMWTFWDCFDLCMFSIVQNENGDHWVIGSEFLAEYSLVFDNEGGKVHFYSSKKNFVLIQKKRVAERVIVLIICVLLLIGVINVLLVNMKGDSK